MNAQAPTTSESVGLCTGLLNHVAAAAGFRVLIVKGSVLEIQGLRGPHHSVDVDALADPATYDALIDHLATHGWSTRPMPELVPDAHAHHAVTLYHDFWPITIDVHRHFPGFLAEPQVVFDALWQRRTGVSVAGIEVSTPDRVSHAALAALHYLRTPESGLTLTNLPELHDRVTAAFTPQDLADLSEFASTVGAGTTLAEWLREIGAPDPLNDAASAEALHSWHARTTRAPSTKWVQHVLALPWRQRPQALRQAVFPSDDEIREYHQLAGETISQARWRRIRRGLRHLPGALRSAAHLSQPR